MMRRRGLLWFGITLMAVVFAGPIVEATEPAAQQLVQQPVMQLAQQVSQQSAQQTAHQAGQVVAMPGGNAGRVYYEIFVRAFADGDGDGIGDFKGLTAKLDYLNDGNSATNTDLGITGIWLMPINESPSYHGYDVTDYQSVEKDYGTMADFEKFIVEAHKRGIKVIMDLVLNHTSDQHPWFKSAVKNGEYRNYYIWGDASKASQTGEWGQKVWHRSSSGYYYGIFWGGMPDLNCANPAVKKELFNSAIFWLKKGVDGFRLDAVKHIFSEPKENNAFLQEFRAALLKVNPEVYLVGEVWDRPEIVSPYYKSLDSNFNFRIGDAIVEHLVGGSKSDIASELKGIYDTYTTVNSKFIDAPFLTNHDQERVMNRLQGRTELMKLAAAIYLTLPGNPFIYYGEEIGMRGAKPDEKIREPFQWKDGETPEESRWELSDNGKVAGRSVDAQAKNPDSLLTWYRRLIQLRTSYNALRLGNFVPLKTDPAYLGFYREYQGEKLVVLHNLTDKWQKLPTELLTSGKYTTIFKEQVKSQIDLSSGDAATNLAPYGTIVLKVIQ